ncbi:MAG TPA: tetratricopeptide repeat protein [Candidatus Acidoferrum sp.]|nr:tetratricopeptide repeat protein [Candidatus Acidoferrum sp.]
MSAASHRDKILSSAFCFFALGGAQLLHSSAAANSPPEKRVTFNRDLAPVVFRTCAPCHHPGEAGPFSLLTYGDVKAHARQIADLTERRIMPPWLPEDGEAKFTGDLHLTSDEVSLFQKWLSDGMPAGDAADLPPAPRFSADWQLGKPDLILYADSSFEVPANGSDVYWNFIFRPPIDSTRWIKAIEIRPGERRLVHHANLIVDRSQSARRREKSAGTGFPGMELQIESESFDPDGHFFFWKPGTILEPEPHDMALRLDPGNDLILNTHLQPSGKPEKIQPALGIYFAEAAATKFPLLLQLENDRKLDIPAGAKNFVVADEFTLPESVSLLAIYPHAHYLGRDILAIAKFPNGKTQTLIHIPRWDLNWQAVFTYTTPIDLPAGTTISMRFQYDNSADNLANPNSPPQRVVAGNRAGDEMAHLWLQVLPQLPTTGANDPRRVLQEAIARHHVENNPQDFEAHYNLAAMLQARGELAPSIDHYQLALALRPGDATVENALGGAFFAAENLPQAIAHLSVAVKSRPDYFDSQYNLGLALAMDNKFSEAVEHLRAAVALRPQDADAEANLGGALAANNQTGEAIAHLRRALQLNPKHSLARENLDSLLRDPAKP